MRIENSSLKDSFHTAEVEYSKIASQKEKAVTAFTDYLHSNAGDSMDIHTARMNQLQHQSDSIRKKVKAWIKSDKVAGDSNDTNYIFLRFVLDYLPAGLVGLLDGQGGQDEFFSSEEDE